MRPIALIIPVVAVTGVMVAHWAISSGPRSSAPDQAESPFSGLRAFEHVERLVALGPRSIGTDSIAEAREYISTRLSELGLDVVRDEFNSIFLDRSYGMENIIGVIPGAIRRPIAIGGHYDTKEIPGANDGGSSAGLLLEMARILVQRSWNHTIWIIFFDGEDTGSDMETMFYGSRRLAGSLRDEDEPRWLIIADMIGDRNLLIRRDRNSDPGLVDLVWSLGRELGYRKHFSNLRFTVYDDHIPFMEIGVPSCVLIDFEYGPLNSYWHTESDDLDKISAGSLQIVGDVLYRALESLDSIPLD
jgi:hypothetical protein